jgi:uroporphyrin-III C-methyltransferase/precorrin-2 dehydrogenase/sirohydrochlorin ferrochelatase
MEFLPIFLRVKGRPVLVVGGGAVAARKVALLRRAGARIRVVAPLLSAELTPLALSGEIDHDARPFGPNDLDEPEIVVAATGDRHVNEAVAALAGARRIPVNVVDEPALCSFIMPAIVDRGRVVAAISTGGAAPVLARLIRARLELLLHPGIGRLAELSARWRDRVRAALPDEAVRRRFWDELLGGPWVARIAAGEEPDIEQLLAEPIAEGGFTIVAVPIDDPDALTLRAFKQIHRANLVLYHASVPSIVLEHARRDATLRVAPDESAARALAAADLADGHNVIWLVPGAAA